MTLSFDAPSAAKAPLAFGAQAGQLYLAQAHKAVDLLSSAAGQQIAEGQTRLHALAEAPGAYADVLREAPQQLRETGERWLAVGQALWAAQLDTVRAIGQLWQDRAQETVEATAPGRTKAKGR